MQTKDHCQTLPFDHGGFCKVLPDHNRAAAIFPHDQVSFVSQAGYETEEIIWCSMAAAEFVMCSGIIGMHA